jgi:hypothetical protein
VTKDHNAHPGGDQDDRGDRHRGAPAQRVDPAGQESRAERDQSGQVPLLENSYVHQPQRGMQQQGADQRAGQQPDRGAPLRAATDERRGPYEQHHDRREQQGPHRRGRVAPCCPKSSATLTSRTTPGDGVGRGARSS